MVRYYQFDCLFDDISPLLFGNYFLLSCFMYLLISIAINGSVLKNRFEYSLNNKALAVFAAISILLVSVIIFSGDYSIGREIQNPVSRLVVRLSLFLQYWLPAIFFLKTWWVYIILYSLALLIFGSKAFIYMLLILSLYFGIINNSKMRYSYVVVIVIGLVISALLFDVILSYRTSKTFDFELLQKSDMFNGSYLEMVTFILNHIGPRWGGLDTLVAYGETGFRFDFLSIIYEFVIGLNNLLPVLKLPTPDKYISSELMTAYLFRGYDFFNIESGGLAHTDSMFGFSRFISVNYGFGVVLFMLCLAFPFVIRFNDYFVDSLLKIYFFSSVIIGGSYAETFRLVFEVILISLLLRHRFIKSVLAKAGKSFFAK